MIDTIILILKLLISILPFVYFCFRNAKVNLEKSSRSKQYYMPVVALIYSLIVMFLLNTINGWIMALIKNLPSWIASAGSIFPEVIADFFTSLGNLVKKFFDAINMKFWIFFISNTLIMIVYLILKKICIAVARKNLENDSETHTRIAGNFYEFFPEKSKWCLKENYVQARSLLKFFYYTAVVISVIMTFVSRRFFLEELINTMFYPVFGIIIVGEVYFYLDGLTKKEYTNDILGEDEDAYKTVNYSLLRKFLRNIFPDKILSENTGVNNDCVNDITNDEVIRELETSENPDIVNFASYIRALNDTGADIDQNYVRSAIDLIGEKSILFNNPFYYDLIPYAFYPMNRILLRHQKVLVILGRHSIENDIKTWIEDGIGSITNIPFMWKIDILSEKVNTDMDTDIGIITRSDVLDMKLHDANREFLENVGFVVIIEPSKLISTAQIGLNMIVKQCLGDGEKKITYCLCDKNCDGLVDAMSHILMTSLTEVSATGKHFGTSSYMCWEADDEYLHHRLFPNVSRYLGVGTELSFAALKNQVSKTQWYGGEAFPVTDIRWIDKQYYYDLMKYAGLPIRQEIMDERFETTSNFWSARTDKHNYFTVEDESFNMFEIIRNFATRSKEQGFVNVISSDYLLRDYMSDNASIFEADAKAIPAIVPDYARTGRNSVLKLILMMSIMPVNTDIIKKELTLIGIKVYDLKKQLWYEIYKCYADVISLSELPKEYEAAVEAVSVLSLGKFTDTVKEIDISLISEADTYNTKQGRLEHTFAIKNNEFIEKCVSELKSAGYVAEDEKGDKYYLGSELSGHIYQKYLPGQFFTFDGKYYEMRFLTPDKQVVVRRAADHITDRPFYRQIRKYEISGIRPSEFIGSCQTVSDMKIVHEYADITVKTDGYFRMKRYHDFETAKKIMFQGEKSGIPERKYHNKEILRIVLPEGDGLLTDKVRYTITTLINEVFRTIFAENCHYIAAVTDNSFIEEDKRDKPLTYSVFAAECELDQNSIYIIEDSQLDLGLTVAVERNWQRILEIINDYLDWHTGALELSLNPPEDPEPPVSLTEPENTTEPENPKKKRGFIGRIWDKIKGVFKRKKKKGDGEKPEEDEASKEPAAPEDGEKPEDNKNGGKKDKKKKGPGLWEKIKNVFRRKKKKNDKEPSGEVPEEKTPAESESPVPEEPAENTPQSETSSGNGKEGEGSEEPALVNVPAEGIIYNTEDEVVTGRYGMFERKPYHARYYLLFGANAESEYLPVPETKEYLDKLGLARNPLKQAREGKKIAEYIEATFKPDKANSRYCDFCGNEITGIEYETLSDGRDRCMECGRTAIKTGAEFRKIFEDVKRNMESFYGIKINVGIKVEMVNSKKLHKRLGKKFISTPDMDGRILGVAIKDKSGYTLMVENGSPRMPSMLTMVHELTHIWQYINWNDRHIVKTYGRDLRLEVYEGMAKWAEIQYAYLINEPAVAKREEIITAYRDDEYGRGFLRYLANYPFSLGTVITGVTPFMNIEMPLDPQFCGPVSYTPVIPGDNGNGETPGPGGNEGDKTPVDPAGKIRNRNTANLMHYAYNQLSEDEKKVYDLMLDAIINFKPEIPISGIQITDEQTKKISKYIQIDHPEIIWFQFGATYYFDTDTHIVSRIEFTYCMTPEEAKKRISQTEKEAEKILGKVNSKMSDYEAVLSIYENIINLVDYDTIGLEQQKQDEISPKEPDDLRSVYGVFVNKKAVCAGYAKAMQYLLNKIGIECTYVTSETHAWNLLKLEGDYYHIDVTWGDNSNTSPDKNVSARIDYDCFCITTEEVMKLDSHIPEADLTLPVCTATKCNYHRRNGLYFTSYSEGKIRSKICEIINNGVYTISFKCSDSKVYKNMTENLIDGGGIHEILRYSNLKSANKVELSYMYSTNEKRLVLSLEFKKS